MLQDLQKATLWKRFSAFLFDFIILITLAVGIMALLSLVMGYDKQNDRLDEIRLEYAASYGINADITDEEMAALTDAEKAKYEEANQAYAADGEVQFITSRLFSMSLVLLSIPLFLSFLILEFIIPLLLKNGQTLGKKIFGVALVRRDSVKVSASQMFVRAILCKYTLETMIPVLLGVMVLFFGVLDMLVLAVVILGIIILQIAMVLSSQTRGAIHDVVAYTVAVEMATQQIFDTVEDKNAFLARVRAEEAEKAPY